MVRPGKYHDAFEPSGPVEVLGVGVQCDTGQRLVIVRVPESEVFELVRPIEFDNEITVKSGDGTEKIRRFTPVDK